MSAVTARRRLVGVDGTRGAALLGMMAVHVLPGVDPDGSTSTPYLIASGRAAATFAVLAGVGLALAYGGRGGRTTAAALAARALAIGAIGLALGYADSGVAVILAYYGLLFVLAIPPLRLRTPALAGLAAACAVVVPVLGHVARQALPRAHTSNPTFADLAERPLALLGELALTGYYPVLAWLTYLCAGLAVGRLDLRSPRVAGGLLAGGLGLAVAASVLSELLLDRLGGRAAIAAATPTLPPGGLDALLSRSRFGTTPTTTWWWLAVDAPHSSTPFDLAHTTGTALALLGALLLLARVGAALLVPLAAAGSMTLSLYVAHVLLLASGALPAHPGTSYALQVVAALAVAVLWRQLRGRGPIEEVVAALARAASTASGRTGSRRMLSG